MEAAAGRFAIAWANRHMIGCGPEVSNMSEESVVEFESEVEVPASALIRVERDRGYGHVPGLEDEELADVQELERQIMLEQWAPILALPCRAYSGGIRPVLDEFGHLDWGAFGTVDFSRIRPEFDKARYKADKLQEQLRDDLIMLDVVRERVDPRAREAVRALALHTETDLEAIENPSEWSYARYLRRIKRLAAEIRDLRQYSRWRRWRAA